MHHLNCVSHHVVCKYTEFKNKYDFERHCVTLTKATLSIFPDSLSLIKEATDALQSARLLQQHPPTRCLPCTNSGENYL